MSDFIHLLKDAAGAPPAPLNMQEVRRRAARLGQRRWRLWLTSLIALGVPAGGVLLPASDRPTQPDQVEIDRDQRQPKGESSPGLGGSPIPARAGISGTAGPASGNGLRTRGSPEAATSDGVAIAFIVDIGRLQVANLDGTYRREVASGVEGRVSWSPDGGRIAYFHCQTGFGVSVGCSEGSGVMVMNSDGSGKRMLMRGSAHPAWSPDGRSIAFARGDGIYTVSPDGTGERRLLASPGYASSLDWSPNGRQLAFTMGWATACVSECYTNVYLVDSDGSNLRQLTFGRQNGREPAWSADGTRIAFVGIPPTVDNPVIHTVRPDGSELTQLTDNPTGPTGQRQGYDSSPDWTPDGRILWVQRGGDPDHGPFDGVAADLYIMNADGSGQTRLFQGDRPAVAPRKA